jgi:tetratricopeptide (TPR) repeat protein
MKNISTNSLKAIILVMLLILTFMKPLIGSILLILFILAIAYTSRAYLYYAKANSKYSKGDIKGSFKMYDKILSIPDCPNAIKITYSYLLLKDRDLVKAQNILNRVNRKSIDAKDSGRLMLTEALVKWRSGNIDEGIEILFKAYKEFLCTTTYESLGYLLILNGDYEKALEINLEAFEYDNTSKVIMDNLAETYFFMEDYEKALEIYTNLIDLNPNFAEPYYYYSLILNEKGETEKALSLLEKALTFKESYLSDLKKSTIQDSINKIKFDTEEMKKVEVKEIESK